MLGEVYLPHMTEFHQLFPESTFAAAPAPLPRQWRMKKVLYSRIMIKSCPVGTECLIVRDEHNSMISYVRCSNEVFALIERRMTAEKNDRISFRVEVGTSGKALVSAKTSVIGDSIVIAAINEQTIPRALGHRWMTVQARRSQRVVTSFRRMPEGKAGKKLPS
jgi:hypothetical protein